MLQKAKMVKKARKALESLYDGRCTVIERQKYQKVNKSTAFREITVLKNEPCRLSFKAIGSSTPEENAAFAVVQAVTLFISPDIFIKSGSKIIVTQNNRTTEYKQSGEPAIYDTHQEIILELFKGWA